jgi:hypothetical protein
LLPLNSAKIALPAGPVVLRQIAENGTACSLTLKAGGAMSDGHEERQERRVRVEQEGRENLEDRIHIDNVDEGEPERVDS